MSVCVVTIQEQPAPGGWAGGEDRRSGGDGAPPLRRAGHQERQVIQGP